jgi:transcriptional regulator with XRE-family HTH domain
MGVASVSAALAMVVRRRVAARVLTAASLVRRSGISQGHVSNWLNGRRELSPAMCDTVLGLLRLSAEQVLNGHVAMPAGSVVEIWRAGDPRRVPAAAIQATPAWRRQSRLRLVGGGSTAA